MEITLKSLQIFERMTQETTAFRATLYVDGKGVGEAGNDGQGGCTWYHAIHHDFIPIIEKAEEYCKSLPPHEWEYGGKKYSRPSNLEMVIDHLVQKLGMEKQNKKFKAKMLKDQKVGVIYGDDKSYEMTYFKGRNGKVPIAEMLSHEATKMNLKITINKIKKELNPGQRILNTNLPKEVL